MLLDVAALKRALHLCVVLVCAAGFLVQTAEFLDLYWTYPTVVDIQVSVPSRIELPSISFCNSNGINPSVVCSLGNFCFGGETLKEVEFCRIFPLICDSAGNAPEDFQAVSYQKFTSSQNFNASVMESLRRPLEDFFSCEIVSGGTSRPCQTEDAILSSYYSDTDIFNLCFTINSLWSQPDKKIMKIKKSDKIRMEFYMDISDRNRSEDPSLPQLPLFGYPSTPSLQLSVNSPYLAASPFSSTGGALVGGKEYKLKLRQNEKHLLPSPYQTNCTDYMVPWADRGRNGPLNERMVVEECKYNISLREIGCVPFSVDYPHNDTVCKFCDNCRDVISKKIRGDPIHNQCDLQAYREHTNGDLDTYLEDICGNLQQLYNHPCYFVTYEMDVEEKLVFLLKKLESKALNLNETMIEKTKGHNCSYENIWSIYCQTVKVEVVFDDFVITNLTYNPKFESLELFSVIGGYMGMYLGVSIVAVYDFGEIAITKVYQILKKRRATKK